MKKETEISGAYKRLFLNEQGGVKPDAQTILDDLYFATYFFRPSLHAVTEPMSLAALEGSREIVKRILSRCGCIKTETVRKTVDMLKGD